MQRIVQLTLLVVAVSAVGVADVLLKKAAAGGGGLIAAMKTPWMLGAVALYALQIILFAHLFLSGAKLSVVGILQTGLYALVTLGAGVFLFQESLTVIQVTGIVLTLVGVALLTA